MKWIQVKPTKQNKITCWWNQEDKDNFIEKQRKEAKKHLEEINLLIVSILPATDISEKNQVITNNRRQ